MNLRRHTRLWRWFAVGVRGISGLAIGSHELRGPGSDFDPSDGVPNRASPALRLLRAIRTSRT